MSADQNNDKSESEIWGLFRTKALRPVGTWQGLKNVTGACEGPWGSGSLDVREVGKQALSPIVCGSWFQLGNSF